jgi:acetyl-CoA carboxylase carboxyltransferase component
MSIDVLATGLGIVTPAGIGVEENRARVCAGPSTAAWDGELAAAQPAELTVSRDREGRQARLASKRIAGLLDSGTFLEFGARAAALSSVSKVPPGDGVIAGTGQIEGRPACVFAQDPQVMGGSLGQIHGRKIVQVMRTAERARCPVVGLLDSGGARIQEGVAALDGYGAIFRANVQLSGRVPQISVILGTCAGGAVYSPALTDIIIAVESAQLFLTGPRVVKAAIFEDISADHLGGAGIHHSVSGVVHLLARDAAHAAELTREVLSFLPGSCDQAPPRAEARPPLEQRDVPPNQRHVYDVRTVIGGILDGGYLLELHQKFAPNIVIGFGRIEGQPVGVVANQPQALCGALDINAAEKAARFVRFCDAFGLPLIALVDTPGFMPGSQQEHAGIIRKGAKLLYAFSEATVPRITIILRKAFGGAYIVMNSKELGADAVFAWPTAQIAVMGAPGAVEIIHRRKLAGDPGLHASLTARYESDVMNPQSAAAAMAVDDIIEPYQTRQVIAASLRMHEHNRPIRFRHDNLPQ